MWWVKNTAKALLLAYAMSTSTPALAQDNALANVPEQKFTLETIMSDKRTKFVNANKMKEILLNYDDKHKSDTKGVESAFKIIDDSIDEEEVRYVTNGEELCQILYHSLDKEMPDSIDFNGKRKYKTLAPVNKLIYASAIIIDKHVHISLRLTDKFIARNSWGIRGLTIPKELDIMVKPVRTDKGYRAELVYSSEKLDVSILAYLRYGIHENYVEAEKNGKTPNKKFVYEMIKDLEDKGLIKVYEK